MTVIAVVGAKGAPGATTAVLAMALGWPGLVLAVDADPAGGDMVAGWLAARISASRGVVSAATGLRHGQPGRPGSPGELLAHCAGLPEVPHLLVLPGLANAGQLGALAAGGWARLADRLAVADWPGRGPLDVLTDCGRLSADTPWPLLAVAELVLLAVRPTIRGVWHACYAVDRLTARLPEPTRLRLLVTGPGPYSAAELAGELHRRVLTVLPDDPTAASALSDGVPAGRRLNRSSLLRAARSAAADLRERPATPAGRPVPTGAPR